MKTTKELFKEFTNIKSPFGFSGDKEKFEWLIKNKDNPNMPTLYLDCDGVAFFGWSEKDDDFESYENDARREMLDFCNDFSGCDSTQILLEAIGIKVECP